MKWGELITVRSTGSGRQSLRTALQELMRDGLHQCGPQCIQAYHRKRIDTDFCIVLSHQEQPARVEGSRMGLRLTDALKAFGLVNHSVWSALE